MPTYEKCGAEVQRMADQLLQEFETHHPLRACGVRIDFLFAHADIDQKTGLAKNDAIRHRGRKALGLCRKIKLKDRAKGMGDAEIILDGDWWASVTEAEQRAVLDHELHHLAYTGEKDDLGRPKLVLREHDFEAGWFTVIAARHGVNSQERRQATAFFEVHGQFYFPELMAVVKSGSRASKLELNQRAA